MYKINNQQKIQIFGGNFVNNNKNKCSMIIDNIKKGISEYIKLSEEKKNQKTLQIKLKYLVKIL